MPVQRDNVTTIPAVLYRPSTTTDHYGNPVAGPDVAVEDCTAGVIPNDIRTDPYRMIGGGPNSLQKWLVIVRGVDAAYPGDAIQVTEGIFIGKYRIQVTEQVPGESFLLAQCIRETTSA